VKRSSGSLLAIVLCGCNGSGPAASWEFSADTLPSGAIHAVNAPALGVGPGWILREDLRVGTLDGDGPASFGGLRGLAVLGDGRFAVLDALAQEVRVFGREGDHIATYGGKGGGPGEFEAPFGLMHHPDGTLWIPDHRNARMSVFDPDRGFQRSYRLLVLRRGFIWGGAMTSVGQVWKPSITLEQPRRNVMRVYGPDMSLLDSLPMPPDPEVDREDPPGAFYWKAADGTASGYFSVPYFPVGQQLIDPQGAVWSTPYGDPAYRITMWKPGEDTTLVLESLRPAVVIPAAERDSAIAVIRDRLRERGAANQDWSKVPTIRPAVITMFVSEVGDLWVLTELEDSQVFDVYGRAGRHRRTVLNSLKLYRWIRPVVRGDELWAVVTDDFDVQYVVRARIERVVMN